MQDTTAASGTTSTTHGLYEVRNPTRYPGIQVAKSAVVCLYAAWEEPHGHDAAGFQDELKIRLFAGCRIFGRTCPVCVSPTNEIILVPDYLLQARYEFSLAIWMYAAERGSQLLCDSTDIGWGIDWLTLGALAIDETTNSQALTSWSSHARCPSPAADAPVSHCAVRTSGMIELDTVPCIRLRPVQFRVHFLGLVSLFAASQGRIVACVLATSPARAPCQWLSCMSHTPKYHGRWGSCTDSGVNGVSSEAFSSGYSPRGSRPAP